MRNAAQVKLDKMAALHKKYAKENPFAGLSFFKRCDSRELRWVIVSRHYPWCRCWHWFWDITFHWPKANRYYWRSFIRFAPRPVHETGKKIAAVGLRFGFFCIYYHRQFCDYQMLDKFFYEQEILH